MRNLALALLVSALGGLRHGNPIYSADAATTRRSGYGAPLAVDYKKGIETLLSTS